MMTVQSNTAGDVVAGPGRARRLRFPLLNLTIVALFGIWCALIWPLERLGRDLLQPAMTVNNGGTLPAAELSAAITLFETTQDDFRCRAELWRAGAALHLAAWQATEPGERADALRRTAERAFGRSLACAPYQGNIWLTLAQLRAGHSGFDAETWDLLDRSYRLAPREGWIMPRRAAFVINATADLPRNVQERVDDEIRSILDSPQWNHLVDMYRGSTPVARVRILAAIEGSSERLRARFHLYVLRGL